ncbi:hypothetical protein SLE2022_001160 [Rubroshorea leprosula]
MHEIKARSNHEMKKNQSWWSLICFVIGAGIFVLTGLEANSVARWWCRRPVLRGRRYSTMLSVFCYTEFALEIPVAGSAVNIP